MPQTIYPLVKSLSMDLNYNQRLCKIIFIGTCRFQQNANLHLSEEIQDVSTIQLTNAHLVFVCDRGIEVTGYQSKV